MKRWKKKPSLTRADVWTAVAILKIFLRRWCLLIARTRWCPLSFFPSLGLFSLFFPFFLFSLCLAGLSWRGSFPGESRCDGFGAEVSGVELADVQVWSLERGKHGGNIGGRKKNDPHRVSTAPGEKFTKKKTEGLKEWRLVGVANAKGLVRFRVFCRRLFLSVDWFTKGSSNTSARMT